MPVLSRLHHHTISFKHAFAGLAYALTTQPNFQVHLLAVVFVTTLGIYLHLPLSDWISLILTMGLVLVAELLNTAIESMVDLITRERRLEAKIAKDVAAGMVLLAAFISLLVGYLVFGKYY